MRVVKQASGFDGGFAVHGQQHRQLSRATPRPFSGPEHLRPLLGRCFSRTAAGYHFFTLAKTFQKDFACRALHVTARARDGFLAAQVPLHPVPFRQRHPS